MKDFLHSVWELSGQVWVGAPESLMKVLSSFPPVYMLIQKNNPNEVFISVVQLVASGTPYPLGGGKEGIDVILFSESLEVHIGKVGLGVTYQW